MAQLDKLPAPGPWNDRDKDWKTQTDSEKKAFDELLITARAVPKGVLVGLLVSFPYADGAAYYRVIKEKPLTLQHIPYGDAWQVPGYQIRGLRKEDIFNLARRHL